MILQRYLMGALSLSMFIIAGCGASGGSGGGGYASQPASAEPEYFGTPTSMNPLSSVNVTMKAKFLYRQTDFTPGASTNGLGAVVTSANAAPIPFAEFHVYNSAGTRIQQGETTTNGTANFYIPKSEGTYTLKVFSRSLNSYYKVSVLNDIYSNAPYFISQSFTITSSDITAGSKDLSSTPVYAEANESLSANVEGGAFNIMFDVLLANEYIRRNIEKNGDTAGTPSSDKNKWFVADKVTIYWKAGFNPNTYLKGTSPLSFYSPGERKLYILGGINGDVKKTDTDHFDDSVILHEYAHFLEDAYGNSKSPGGSHNGNFVIDPRLAWSEGWATYFASAVLTGTDAYGDSPQGAEDRLPSNKRFQYYIDTYGYKGSGTWGVNASVNLAAVGTSVTEPDSVSADLSGTGTFREISVARTLYKSSRQIASTYDTGKTGGGVSFKNYWKAFSGEEKNSSTHENPAAYSLSNTVSYPIPNMGLFNWLLSKNGVSGSGWDAILSEEKQNKSTRDYAHLLTSGNCNFTFTTSTAEVYMGPGDPVKRSNPQVNNDFYLIYHDGVSSPTYAISYSNSGTATLDLDLVLYKAPVYVYFEDTYWYAGQSSSSVVKQSRTTGTTSETINLQGLAAGYYLLNVKVNTYNKTTANQLSGSATYTITLDGEQQCGTERP